MKLRKPDNGAAMAFSERLEPRRLLSATFAPVVTYPTGGMYPQALAVADFNRDGLPDVAVTNAASGTVTVFFNQGGGTFAPQTPFNVGPNPSGIVAADFNGDGKPDLAVVGNDLAICLNQGGGVFGTPTHIAVGQIPQLVISADFNGDGKPDLAVTNIGSNSVSILLGQGGGQFASPTSVTGIAGAAGMVAGDFNGDGKQDLAVTALGTYDSMNNTYGSGAGLYILTGDGSGGFTKSAPITVGTRPVWVTAGDLNGDGKPDLVVANGGVNDSTGQNTVSVLLNDGSGGFAAAQSYATGSTPECVGLGNFSGDGPLDIVTANFNSGDISYLANSGSGTFQNLGAITGLTGNAELAVADVNGDNVPDILIDGFNDGTLGVILDSPQVLPTVSLTTSSPTSTIGQSITLTATVTPPTGITTVPTGLVTFLSNGTSVGSAMLDLSGAATLMTTVLPAGVDSLTASYAGDSNFTTATSAPVAETVMTPVPLISLASSNVVPNSGQSVTFTATVTARVGDIGEPTGSVTFLQDGTSIGTANLNASGIATLTTASLPDGVTQITAHYSGDGSFDSATSTAVAEMTSPGSGLQATLNGALPSIIAGQKSHIHQKLTLTNSGPAFSGTPALQLYLASSTAIGSDAMTLATVASKRLNIKSGKHASLNFIISSVPSTVPAGTYHLAVLMSDGSGHTSVGISSNTLSVTAPVIDLGGHFATTPKAPRAGRPVVARIVLTNAGNIAVSGSLAIIVDTSAISMFDGTAVQAVSISKHVNVKPGKSMPLSIPGIPLPKASGSYYLIVRLDPNNLLQDVNLANNVFATATPIAVVG